ncbi:autotransporter outer membrane beta-barrel domain-containing protein [Pseudomonas sichuanensis]|uniref:Autotransporter outer membrane beta-barrel domain-containing protein n=1 Tax=Pseudomonas sichuanensis TaxID=2213015 RepID=A0ABV0DBT1_9PSED
MAVSAHAVDIIEVPAGDSHTVGQGDPVNRYHLLGGTLNVTQGAQTERILGRNGAQLNMSGATVNTVGIAGISLFDSNAVIDGSTITATADPARPGDSAAGITLQDSNASVSNSRVSGSGHGINAAGSSVLDLSNSQVDGRALANGSGPLAGGVGLVATGATVRIRENSVISGDDNGVVLYTSSLFPGRPATTLSLDGSAIVGRNGSAIRVIRAPGADEAVQIDISNGSTLSGGNGVIIEVVEGGRANAVVNDSQLTGNIVVDEDSTLDLKLTNHASLTGRLDNVTSLVLEDASSWVVTGDSTVGSLSLDTGTVDLRGNAPGAAYNHLQVGELSGSGTFMLRADLTGQQGDFLDVSGKASGDHQLLVQSTGTDPNSAVDAHQVVHTGQGSTSQFGLIGGQVDFGTFAYELEQRGDDWFLVRKGDTTTPGTRSVTGLFSAAPTVWYGESSTLRGRMGELRNGQQSGGGWMRSYANKYQVAAGAGAAYEQVQQGVAFGADAPLPSSNGQWLVGLMGGYSRSQLDLSGGTTGQVDSYHIGAYSTWLADDGLYIDALIKANRFQNSSDVRMSDGRKAKGEYSNHGIGASVEVGKHFKLDDGWFVEPYAQGSALWVDGASYSLDNGMRASTRNADSLLAKAGSHVGRTFALADGGFVQPYVKAAYAHEFARDNQVRVNDTRFANDLSGSRVELGAGINAQLTDVLQVQAGFDYMKGERIEQPWGVNLGVRYNW